MAVPCWVGAPRAPVLRGALGAPFSIKMLVLLDIPQILPFIYYSAKKQGWSAHIPRVSGYGAAAVPRNKEDAQDGDGG